MDPNGYIYESDDAPEEDKARFDRYLKQRAEADKRAYLLAKIAEKGTQTIRTALPHFEDSE